jgi:hypothetical protein
MANPTAVIYFKRDPASSAMAKDLAARVRNDGPKTLMIWADRFKDEQDVEETARAVIIQQSAGNCSLIIKLYETFAAGVEIHLVSDDGDFIEGDKLDLQAESETEPADPVEPDPEEPAADAAGDSAGDSGAPAEDVQPAETDET